MALVNAKCTTCGASLEVNDNAKQLVCRYCGSEFVVEQAINNYNNYLNADKVEVKGDLEIKDANVNEIKAENVTINAGFDEKKELENARFFTIPLHFLKKGRIKTCCC